MESLFNGKNFVSFGKPPPPRPPLPCKCKPRQCHQWQWRRPTADDRRPSGRRPGRAGRGRLTLHGAHDKPRALALREPRPGYPRGRGTTQKEDEGQAGIDDGVVTPHWHQCPRSIGNTGPPRGAQRLVAWHASAGAHKLATPHNILNRHAAACASRRLPPRDGQVADCSSGMAS